MACNNSRANGFECFIYGQAAALNRELSAAGLVELLVEETGDALNTGNG